jgi:magnesium-transporting ATPase (P-type)
MRSLAPSYQAKYGKILMSTNIVKVRRRGSARKVESCELVFGDVILLEIGDIVPADARLVESNQTDLTLI